MKKILAYLLAGTLIFSFTLCGSAVRQAEAASEDAAASESETEDSASQTNSVLVAYFSWADNAVLADDVDAVASPSVIPPGNVQQLAGWVQEETGGLARSVEIITETAPDAVISDDIFDCYEEDASSSEDAIRDWVNGLGYSHPSETETDSQAAEQRQISVQFGENTVVYELNDGTAADSLCEQLPLTIEVEDYSTNEKIFYPPQALDTSDSPTAQAGAGTLAYYEPWGDVVFFYGDYNENPSLFELGQIVSGGELVSEMSGTITIEALE
ncbi:MAG TPA: hypothetical protein IAA05_13470 [Candidatus Blautia excrementipullorum]|nr:hypothetical protein [Candidatus Blautia excrementipullorum]